MALGSVARHGRNDDDKKEKPAKGADARSAVAASSTAEERAAFKENRRNLRDRCLQLARLKREQARLAAAFKACAEETFPLLREVGDSGKQFTLEDGTVVEIKNGGGGKSATKTAIVEHFKARGEKFWDGLTPAERTEYVSVSIPKKDEAGEQGEES